MGIWYSIEGTVKVQDNDTTRDIVSRLKDASGEMEVSGDDGDDGTLTVSVGGGMQCNPTTADAFESILAEFDPHVVKTACFNTNVHDEPGEFWVGSEDGRRQALIKAAWDALDAL